MRPLAESVAHGLLAAVFTVLARLPWRPAYWLGARVGDMAYLCLARRRRVTLDNLEIAFGSDKSAAERRAIARATFRNLGEHLIDFSRLRWLTPDTFQAVVTVEGLERVERLLARRAGLLMLSAHFGSWELAAAIALRLAPRLHVIVRPLDNPALDRLVDAYRRHVGCDVIPKNQALPASLKALRRGDIIALLMDQSSLRREGNPGAVLRRRGLHLHWSGADGPAFRVSGHRRLPGAAGSRQAPAGIQRGNTDSAQAAICGGTSRIIHGASTSLIESYVRAHPDHWFWLHRRWKKR